MPRTSTPSTRGPRGRKKGARKTNTGAKARAKDRSTAVSQNVKVNVGALRGRLGQRPSYTMPSFGGGGSAHVNLTIPHPLPSFDQQAGYSIHTLSSNVDNLVRYLQQTQGAQPIPGPSSEALARSAVMSIGTQTEPTLPKGASGDMRNLDMLANMQPPPVTRTSKSEGGTQTDPMPPIKPESGARQDAGTDPIDFASAPGPATRDAGSDAVGAPTQNTGSDPIIPPARSFGTNTDDMGVGSSSSGPRMSSAGTQTMLGQSVGTNTDPLHFNVGARSRELPPRPQPMEVDMSRRPASKRKSGGDHTGLTGIVGRPEYTSNVRAEAPNGLGPRPHVFDGLTGRYPFVYPRKYPFNAQEAVPPFVERRKGAMGGFDFSGGVSRPNLERAPAIKRSLNPNPGTTGDVPRAEFNPYAISMNSEGPGGANRKRKRDPLAPQGGVRKMQRIGKRPRRGEAQILRNDNEIRESEAAHRRLRAAMGHS